MKFSDIVREVVAFLNFLRGMETQDANAAVHLWFCFLNFLRGMET